MGEIRSFLLKRASQTLHCWHLNRSILCGGDLPVHCWGPSSIPGPHPTDASASSQVVTTKMSPDTVNVVWGAVIPPYPCHRAEKLCSRI